MLQLDIEFLLDTCFAVRNPADNNAEWPPQPDRVFSALVASWGARGERVEERLALEWLESLPAPSVDSVEGQRRAVVTAYVPPNDAALTDIRILPERRRRQPRRFPAVTLPRVPGQAHLRLTWPESPSEAHRQALSALAADTSYIGHSASVVRCRFTDNDATLEHGQRALAVRAPYPGRLRELAAQHRRHVENADANARPRPVALMTTANVETEHPRSIFGQRWVVLECSGGERPAMGASAIWCRALRHALMSHWDGEIPEWLSGHAKDGTPSREPHMALLPLAYVGYAHSDGAVLGIALVLPRALERDILGTDAPHAYANRQRLFAAMRRAAGDEGEIRLCAGVHGVVHVRMVTDPSAYSLRPQRYFGPSSTWTTVTPIALDRHPDQARSREEAAEIVATSCARIGLPAPQVIVHKHPAITGALSARPPGGAPAWSGWTRPKSLVHRPLTHATLRFEAPVAGPVVLGAGRFHGLGLCMPFGNGRTA